jgi:hypothetical protein
MANVYFDVSANSQPLGRIVLYALANILLRGRYANFGLANCMTMLSQGLPEISVNCVPDKMDM